MRVILTSTDRRLLFTLRRTDGGKLVVDGKSPEPRRCLLSTRFPFFCEKKNRKIFCENLVVVFGEKL